MSFCLFMQVTLLHGRSHTCCPHRTQREKRVLFLVCVVSVGLFISLITTGVFYKQSECKDLFKLCTTVTCTVLRNTCARCEVGQPDEYRGKK